MTYKNIEYNDEEPSEIESMRTENASLRAEAAERREDHMKLVEENHELRQQLAASQLEAKRLREALEEFVNGADECLDDGGWTAMVVSMEAYHICDEALSSPTSTDALDAYVAHQLHDVACDKGLLRIQVAELTRQRDLAVSALEYHQSQTRPIENTMKALAAIKESEV